MTDAERPNFDAHVQAMAGAHSQYLKPDTLDWYWFNLHGLTMDRLLIAMAAAERESKFLPSPGSIARCAESVPIEERRAESPPEPIRSLDDIRTRDEWAHASVQLMRRIGRYAKPGDGGAGYQRALHEEADDLQLEGSEWASMVVGLLANDPANLDTEGGRTFRCHMCQDRGLRLVQRTSGLHAEPCLCGEGSSQRDAFQRWTDGLRGKGVLSWDDLERERKLRQRRDPEDP